MSVVKEVNLIDKGEVCNNWNETFPELNMSIGELNNPTEAFLTRTFIFYLRAFGYVVEPPFQCDLDTVPPDSQEKRLFLIKLCRHIEQILQISVKSRSFCYYDLIKPSPKKTLNTLDILYNYLCYFNMFKKDVFARGEDRIRMYEKLPVKIAEMKLEIAKRKKHTKRLKAKISELNKVLKARKPEFEALMAQKCAKEKLVEKLKVENLNTDRKLSALRAQKEHWKHLEMEDSTMHSLLNQLEKLQQNISACKEDTDKQVAQLKERQTNIDNTKELCAMIIKLQETIPMRLIRENERITAQLEESLKEQGVKEKERNDIIETIDEISQQLELVEEKLKMQSEVHMQEQQSLMDMISEEKRSINENTSLLRTMEKKNQALDLKIQEQVLIEEKLYESVEELLSIYRNIEYNTE